ncbi:folylpolyglutamate synthase/dihydrofolate synthase family protein [Euzebya sp.]|uniref:bifunctional folylpolyglutamate synthase/dihydrofolate synthase n=1 Tax=Euzebya sp. TaxID=1971409 RepID=UPI0035137614
MTSDASRPPADAITDLPSAVAALGARSAGRMVPDLDRITDLVELLGQPQTTYDTIHLTGTNGKTSTTAILSSLLLAAGLVPGSFSSPHLQDVRERIRIGGRPIDGEDLARHLAFATPFLEVVDARHGDDVTYFEVLTAIAFLHFADVPVNVGLFEVGMGGTWDATNVIDAGVAVLLRVALDHRELGDTPAQIAVEKSGIIKPDAHVVSAAQEPAVAEVIRQRADEMNAQVKVAGTDFELLGRTPAVGGQQIDLRGVRGEYHELYLPLFGRHQAANAAMALAAFEAYSRYEIELERDLIQEGFANARVPGRLEPIPRDGQSLVLLDGAHNASGMAALAEALGQDFAFERRVAVLGILDDKDVEGMVTAIAPAVDHVVAVAPDNRRAADPGRIAAACEAVGLSVEEADDAEHAMDLADGVTRPSDGVVVAGSLYLVGEVRSILDLDPA